MSPLWGGRFTGQTDPLMARFNASLPFDWRLWDADITGSVAWARAIARAGLLTTKSAIRSSPGLQPYATRSRPIRPRRLPARADEDIHSYVERRLTEQIGAAAGKLHTGRSRNDQVATDVRLWLKWQIVGLESGVRSQGTGDRGQETEELASVAASAHGTDRPPASSLDSALADLIRAAADRAERGA